MPPTTHKNLFHSELARLDWVEITITGEVTPSKFKGKPPYVRVLLDGAERLYQVENDHVQECLTGLKGWHGQMKATGSREEADLEFGEGQFDDSGPPSRPEAQSGKPGRNAPPARPGGARPSPGAGPVQKPARQPAKPAPLPPAHPPADQPRTAELPRDPGPKLHPVTRARQFIMQLVNLSLLAQDAAEFAAEQYETKHKRPMVREKVDALATTYMLECLKNRMHWELPADHVMKSYQPKPGAPRAENHHGPLLAPPDHAPTQLKGGEGTHLELPEAPQPGETPDNIPRGPQPGERGPQPEGYEPGEDPNETDVPF